MSYNKNEKEVLKKLNVNSFRELSKDKILDFMSMLPEMDPEVAKKALEQFPDFVSCSTKVLKEYKEAALKAMESGGKGFEQVAQGRLITIDSLSKMLEQDNLSFEQKMVIAEKMTELGDKNSQDLEKHQNFLVEILKSIALPCTIIIVAAASILGLKVNVHKK